MNGVVLALLAMTSLAMAALLLPLLAQRRNNAGRAAYNMAVYRDQLGEVERDIARGVLTPEQAEAARTEISRRILALPAAETETAGATMPSMVAIGSILLLPVAAWAIYWQLGSPLLPDQPFADRGNAPTQVAAQVAGSDAASPHDIDDALVRLNTHLKEKPDDLTGWLLLGRTEISLNHYPAAAAAFGRAYELSGHRADVAGDWGEAQIMAANGAVTAGAKQAFEVALQDPENAPRSRYYLALAQLQQGDAKGALDAWHKLEADSPKDAEWLPLLRQRIAEAEGKPTGKPPPSQPQTTAAPDPATVAATAKATADASPEQRQTMIRGMVESLAAKLADKPDDLDGWTRLGRSYMVLNDAGKAREAYAHALKLKPADLPLKLAYADAIVATAAPDATAPPADAVSVYRDVLAADPQNQEALWYIGIAEAEAGHADQARELWSRLLAQLPANAPEHKAVTDRIAALKPGG